jgi:hypothetical protein
VTASWVIVHDSVAAPMVHDVVAHGYTVVISSRRVASTDVWSLHALWTDSRDAHAVVDRRLALGTRRGPRGSRGRTGNFGESVIRLQCSTGFLAMLGRRVPMIL